MKLRKKGKLKKAFIDAAQAARNILVLEPANKHRVKREIFEAKKAGKSVGRYHQRLEDGQGFTVMTMLVSGIPVLLVGGVLGAAVAPVFFTAGMGGAIACVTLSFISMLKMSYFGFSDHAIDRITSRFERQAEKRLNRLKQAQRKRTKQLLMSDI